MQDTPPLCFDAYRLDPDDERLWRGTQVVRLTSKAFQVLWQLAARSQQLVTKEELFASVWPETAVSDAALTSSIRELRRALQDNPKRPTYIETVHRRGFRFLKAVQSQRSEREPPASMSFVRFSPPYVVGRQAELEQLWVWVEQARHGNRQMVFVTGEPGIGKTTVVSALVRRLARDDPVWVGQGQCIEHYGAGEAYMPVLEALGRLCRARQGERLVALLRRHAPTWLAQMPTLLAATELEALQRTVAGTTPTRMLREMAEAVEAITAEIPLVLILEDLQWSDYSTVELLAALARRREAARLLVIATYRPVDVLVHEHPLSRVKQELQLHGQCQELALEFLSAAAVDDYLAERFADGGAHAFSLPGLASFIHRWTDGNPLFMVTLVDALVQYSVLSEVGGAWVLRSRPEDFEIEIPATLLHLIEQQIEQLSPEEQGILQAASVAGAAFSAAVLTVAGDAVAESVEAVCEGLARRAQFVRAAGTAVWPDGTVAARYGFIHALYREVAYARVPAGRRMRLHRQIGERLEAAYGEQASTIAAELGMHFAQGQDYPKAVQYWRQAGSRAAASSTYREAVTCFEQALAALAHLPERRDTLEQAIALRIELRNALHPLGEDERIIDNLRTAEAVAERLGDDQRLGQIALYLCIYFSTVDEHDRAVVAGQRALTLGASIGAVDLQAVAQCNLAVVYDDMGDYRQALDFSRQAMALLTGELLYERLGQALLPALVSRGQGALSLAELGSFADARSLVEDALRLAEVVAQPYQIASTRRYVGMVYRRQGRFHQAIPVLEQCLALSQSVNITRFFPLIAATLGAAYAMIGRVAEAVPLLNRVLEYIATGSHVPHHAFVLTELSEAVLLVGRTEEASALTERLYELSCTHTGRSFQAHAYRLLGEVAMRRDPPEIDQAKTHYQNALTLADELSMGPLQAHCHRALGMLYAMVGHQEQARAALATAIESYRAMDMTFWLPQTESALAQVEGR
jgi:DNA-binding winged helix-turn-helix (wHTH) protein/tetratricopeptide (TPR) repeat protein